MRDMVQKAFWDMVDEKLKEDPPDYSYALEFFTDLKQASVTCVFASYLN